MIKAMALGAVLSAVLALVIGAQGLNGGALAIHLVDLGKISVYWSWPLFFAGSGLSFGVILLQR